MLILQAIVDRKTLPSSTYGYNLIICTSIRHSNVDNFRLVIFESAIVKAIEIKNKYVLNVWHT